MTMLDEEPCFMFIVLCTDFYTYCDLLSISCTNKSDRPLDCHGKVNCVVSQLFSRTLTLGLLG